MKGAGKLAAPASADQFTYPAIQSLPTPGNRIARSKLRRALSALLRTRLAPSERDKRLAEYLIDHALDNGAPIDVITKIAYKLGKTFQLLYSSKANAQLFLGLKIIIRRFTISKPRQMLKNFYLSFVTIKKHNPSKLPEMINQLLDILVSKNVMPLETAHVLLKASGT